VTETAPRSIDAVCEVERFDPPDAEPGAPPRVLFELPHGATSTASYERLRARLSSRLPERLERFFHVNTDMGSPDVAREAALALSRPESSPTLGRLGVPGRPVSALIVRSLVPRTFIDCNRLVELSTDDYRRQRFTPAIPEYVTEPADRELLSALHREYQTVAQRAYDLVCGRGGVAVALHTYAPRSVDIHRLDVDIVTQLEEAYAPERYDSWPLRPPVDVIDETEDGERLAPRGMVERLRALYGLLGVEVTENATYRLHPSTLGYRHCRTHAGRVLCLEINRGLLADPFEPFVEMRVSRTKAERMAAPLAAACLDPIA
jgi:hypothetical protein